MMAGFGKNRNRRANFWNMHGVYALYSGAELVYVGQVFKLNLGDRLKQHTLGEKSERWDTFSWYGIQDVVKQRGKDGYLKLGKLNGAESEKIESVIESFESLVIRIADPELNRRRGKFAKGEDKAERFRQFEMTTPDEEMQQKLTTLLKVTNSQSKTIEKILGKVSSLKTTE
jgi:hypothetical protein